MNKKKKWFYVVWIGRNPGVFKTWNECQKQISGFEGNKFKKFPNIRLAEKAYSEGWEYYWGKERNRKHTKKKSSTNKVYHKTELVSFNIGELIDHINQSFDKESRDYIKSRI